MSLFEHKQPFPPTPRPLTEQEAEDALERIRMATGSVQLTTPIAVLPLLVGMIQGAVECPDVNTRMKRLLYQLQFLVMGNLADMVPGLPAALMLSLDVDATAYAIYAELANDLNSPEYDALTVTTTEGGE